MDTYSFDVLVVGAGPAGCAAAIRAAARGLTVGIVERVRLPRDVPGEALHPDVDRLFDELGVMDSVSAAGFVRYPGWLLERAAERDYVPFGDTFNLRFGYQAWRAQLDSILLAQARRLGVAVLEHTNPGDVLISAGRVVGLETGTYRLTADQLIDATGVRRWLSRKLGVPVIRVSPKLVVRYGYSSRDFGLGTIPQFHEHASGWTWLARIRDDCCQCVQLALAPDAEVPPIPAHFGFPAHLRGADATWSVVLECAGTGYFICGDAAATLDPAASSGVARAMASGVKAADLVVEIAAGEMDETDAARTYREWLAGAFGSEALRLASRYSAFEDPPGWINEFHHKWANRVAANIP